ncbi:hypothetical protein SNEBB_001178 [Seison nebaliae]|nr:hypothetical protein SNEBB_001178 [Seison nebaliae]
MSSQNTIRSSKLSPIGTRKESSKSNRHENSNHSKRMGIEKFRRDKKDKPRFSDGNKKDIQLKLDKFAKSVEDLRDVPRLSVSMNSPRNSLDIDLKKKIDYTNKGYHNQLTDKYENELEQQPRATLNRISISESVDHLNRPRSLAGMPSLEHTEWITGFRNSLQQRFTEENIIKPKK